MADMNVYIHARTNDMKHFLDTVSVRISIDHKPSTPPSLSTYSLLDQTLAPADKPGLVDEPEIDLQVEMASIFHHLMNMRASIAEHHGQVSSVHSNNPKLID